MPFQATIRDSLLGKRFDRRLFITGHSLGAGLATLAAADLASQGAAHSPTTYTFGSPRVGDKQFASKYNALTAATSFRIANTCDLVTAIPFPVPFLSFIGGYFTHVETPVEFTFQSEDAGRNHHMETYLSALKAAPPRKGLFAYLFR